MREGPGDAAGPFFLHYTCSMSTFYGQNPELPPYMLAEPELLPWQPDRAPLFSAADGRVFEDFHLGPEVYCLAGGLGAKVGDAVHEALYVAYSQKTHDAHEFRRVSADVLRSRPHLLGCFRQLVPLLSSSRYQRERRASVMLLVRYGFALTHTIQVDAPVVGVTVEPYLQLNHFAPWRELPRLLERALTLHNATVCAICENRRTLRGGITRNVKPCPACTQLEGFPGEDVL